MKKKWKNTRKFTLTNVNCDFCSENFLTMEVHLVKLNSEKLEYGLINYDAKDIETLNMQISTCQIYVCDDCFFRTVHIHDIMNPLSMEK